ncbi:MAG: hypothetical protein JSW11_08290 [Candidatus Heimdallarchaeota archaeon]|nr:MAG: hypothetical protein JSW11_08290 [Candidatus Heimdallarchaeota archaeon]
MKKLNHFYLLGVRSIKFLFVVVFISVITIPSITTGHLTLLALQTSPYVTNQGIDDVKIDKLVEQDLDSNLLSSVQSQLPDLSFLENDLLEKNISQDWMDIMLEPKTTPYDFGSSTETESSTVVLDKTDSMIKTQTTYTDDSVLTSTKMMVGTPKIKITECDAGELDDLVIPIIREKKSVNTESESSSIRTVKKEVDIGFESSAIWYEYHQLLWLEEERRGWPNPWADWYFPLYESLGNETARRERDQRTYHFMKLACWYNIIFKLNFKLEVEISYPEECFIDHPYELKVAIRPLVGTLSLRLVPLTDFKVFHYLWEETYREVDEYDEFMDWVLGNKAIRLCWGWTLVDMLFLKTDEAFIEGDFWTPLGDQPGLLRSRYINWNSFGHELTTHRNVLSWGQFGWDQGLYTLWENRFTQAGGYHHLAKPDTVTPRNTYSYFPIAKMAPINEKPQLIDWIRLDALDAVLFCDRVTARLTVSADSWQDSRLMAWGEEHSQDPSCQTAKSGLISDLSDGVFSDWHHEDTLLYDFRYGLNGEDYNSLKFILPSHMSGSSVRFSVSELAYCLESLTFNPKMHIQALGYHLNEGWDYSHLIPDPESYWGPTKYGLLPKRKLPIDTLVPYSPPSWTVGSVFYQLWFYNRWSTYPLLSSTFHYSTGTSAPVRDANYDFDMTITSLNESSLSARDHAYSVDLTSLGNNEDFIELQVINLPLGFTASFDRYPAAYDISPSRKNTAFLTIHAPDYPSVPPNPLSFSLVARSQGKSLTKDYPISITRNVVYTPPVTYGLDFNFDMPDGEVISVSPGEVFSLGFSGINLGNVPDNFTVQGVLQGVEGTTREWKSNFSVDRFNTAGQSFTGVFNLTYHPTDYFPLPGAYTLDINATSENDPSIQQLTTHTIEFLPFFNVSSTLTPNTSTLLANYEQEFVLSVTNTGNIMDNYSISVDGWTDFLSLEETHIDNLYHENTHNIVARLSIPDPTIVPVQEYVFRIIIRSEGDSQVYSMHEVTVNVLEPDLTPPGISPQEYNGCTIVYPREEEFWTMNLGPSWIPIDANPDSYWVFVNGTLRRSDSWVSGERIHVIMKDNVGVTWVPGLYNVTVVFSDTTGNEKKDMVWVQIDPTDYDPPIIAPSIQLVWHDNFHPTAYVLATGNNFALPVNWNNTLAFNWQFTEAYPLNVTLFLDGTAIPQSECIIWRDSNSSLNTWNATYILSPKSLTEATWNFTLTVSDMSGFSVSSTLLLDIGSADTNDPVLLTSPGSSAIQGHGETVAFTATDPYPLYWEVVVNKKAQLAGTWSATIPANISVDGLKLKIGENPVELHIYDIAGNFYNHSWNLTYIDVDFPQIKSTPSDMVVFEHNSSWVQRPIWIVEDANPDKYSIYMNEELLYNGTWSTFNNTVTLPIDHLRKGTYEFRAVFTDSSDNENSSSFVLTVEDIIPPAIVPLESIIYEQFHTPNWFEYIIDESNPNSYQLYRNGILIDEGAILPHFKVVLVDLNYIPEGDYNFTLRMTDESGNVGIGSVDVTVLDYSPPVIEGPPLVVISEGTPLLWTINELNPKAYSLYRNGGLVVSGSLTNQLVNITYNTGDLDLGTYEFILVVEDQHGLTRSLTTFVHVVDITSPQISSVGEYTAELGDSNAYVTWNVIEKHPSYYQIQVDGVTQQEGQWSGDTIELPLVGWAEGTYTVKLIVTDSSGNSAWDEVTVTVVDSRKLLSTVSVSGSGWSALLVLVSLICLASVISRCRFKKG